MGGHKRGRREKKKIDAKGLGPRKFEKRNREKSKRRGESLKLLGNLRGPGRDWAEVFVREAI